MSVLDGPGEGTWSVFALKVVEERDELRHKLAGETAHIKSLEGLLVDAANERDEARALAAKVADAWRKKVEEVEDQRNALRSEVDKLRHERRMFRRRLVECLPWVGCTPYPNTSHFSEMIACRDLAKDTLDEVPE
jgi:hypothetical protein